MPPWSRRKAVAALGGLVAWSGATKTAAAQGAKDAGLQGNQPTGPLDLRALGAPLDGKRSDSNAIQRATNALVARKPIGGSITIADGPVLITDAIELRHYTTLDFGRSEVTLRPTQAYAIGVGLNEHAFSTTISGRFLQLWGEGKSAISVRNASGFQMVGCDIDLHSPRQCGLLVTANDDPVGPYYGLVDNVRVNGTSAAGQVGIALKQKYAAGSIGVNRWIIGNLRHIASVEVGMDIQGTMGLVVSNANFETCHNSAVRFGFGSRAVRGRVEAPRGAGGFNSHALAEMALDRVGDIQILSGPNRGRSMIVITITETGDVIFPEPFPFAFTRGDEFIFTECKCSGVGMLNTTYEGGAGREEVAFNFLAGTRSCKVDIAMITMGQGYYFRREIEDLSNTIARTNETIRLSANLSAEPGDFWLPTNAATPGSGGFMLRGAGWVDAIFVTAESDSGGSIDVDLYAGGRSQGLIASLTPDSPVHGRRVRLALPVNAVLNPGEHYQVKVTKRGTSKPVRINVEIVLAYL